MADASPEHRLSGAAVLAVVRVSAAAALQLPAAQLRAQLTAAPEGRWLLLAGADPAQALRAVAYLRQHGVASEDLWLQCRWTAEAELRRLRNAGAGGVAWVVQSIAPRHRGVAQLRTALALARGLGLQVQLRWQLGLAQLSELEAWAHDPGPPLACDEVVLLPLLQPGHTVDAATLRRLWPAERPDGPKLIASQLWPRCVDLPARWLEPAGEADGADLVHPAACQGCPAQRHCPGIPRLLWQASVAAPQPWQGSRVAAPAAGPPQQVIYDRHAVELRGLRLGLRDAWRLRVAAAELAAFAEHAERDGWHVAWSPQRYSAAAGGRLRPAPPASAAVGDAEAAHLVVVARSAAIAQACVADELALLDDDAPAAAQSAVAAVAAMAEAHRRLGRAYGFPACCVEAFCDAFAEVVYTRRAGDNAVAVLRAAQRSERFDRRCFTLVAGLGAANRQPLRHLPCRFDCPASIALATALDPGGPPAASGDLPVVVWADGSFAVLQGRVCAADRVDEVRGCSVFGFDPRAPQQRADRQRFAAPLTWQRLRVAPGVLEFGAPPQEIAVDERALPWGGHFPLLLPFAALSAAPVA